MTASPDSATHAKREGRLADPGRDLRSDPRTDPRLLAALAAYGLDAPAAPPPFDRSAGMAAIAEFVGGADAAFDALYATMPNDLPGDGKQAVSHATETLRGPTGEQIVLHVARPVGVEGPLPCTVYVHGGGMTILSTDNKVHRQWRTDLAATGMVAIGLDFRNAWTADGLNPFPAGLDDCSAAVAWISQNRAHLGITKVVLQGESGGANLVLATALKALRDGGIDAIDGVYATVPYVSGGYGWPQERKLAELPSLYENEGYFLNTAMMDLLVAVYDPTGDNAENPLCWPYFATVEDLRGLPPHVISVNELDPLRDEGLAYYRKLLAAGVDVTGRVNLGITHGADMIFRQAVPDVYRSAIADIKRFADSL